MPEAFFVDNGVTLGRYSRRAVDPVLGVAAQARIAVIQSRPYHPQSRGKNERFHLTLAAEVFALHAFVISPETQRAFDAWREVYNFERPHEALGQQVPASRYRPSQRSMPDRLPEVEYDSHEIVRRVSTTKAYVSFKGHFWKVPQAFLGRLRRQTHLNHHSDLASPLPS